MAECLLKVTERVSGGEADPCCQRLPVHSSGDMLRDARYPRAASDIIHPDYCCFSTGGMISLTLKQAYFCGMLFVAYFYFSCINEGVMVGILLKLLGFH